MSIFQGTPETLASLVADGVQNRLYGAIRTQLMALATPIVEKAAKEMAEALVGRVETFSNHLQNKVEVHVQFTPAARAAVQKVADGV